MTIAGDRTALCRAGRPVVVTTRRGDETAAAGHRVGRGKDVSVAGTVMFQASDKAFQTDGCGIWKS